jgi:hypothetical protein
MDMWIITYHCGEYIAERSTLGAGKSGWYVGTPELGLVNIGNAHIKEHPNAPLANNPEACSKLYNVSLRILQQSDAGFNPASGPIEMEYAQA